MISNISVPMPEYPEWYITTEAAQAWEAAEMVAGTWWASSGMLHANLSSILLLLVSIYISYTVRMAAVAWNLRKREKCSWQFGGIIPPCQTLISTNDRCVHVIDTTAVPSYSGNQCWSATSTTTTRTTAWIPVISNRMTSTDKVQCTFLVQTEPHYKKKSAVM